MAELPLALIAGMRLKKLIYANYKRQEDFAYDFGVDPRSVNRYVNEGITKVPAIQEFADFFHVDYTCFFTLD